MEKILKKARLVLAMNQATKKDLTVTLHAGQERFNDLMDNCENAFNPYVDYPK